MSKLVPCYDGRRHRWQDRFSALTGDRRWWCERCGLIVTRSPR